MRTNHEVDWVKTKKNINARLKGRARVSSFLEQFNLTDRSCQNKINPDNPTTLSISELSIIARYLGCDMLDLIVFCEDRYVEPYSHKERNVHPEHKTPEEIDKALCMRDFMQDGYEIRDVYEFLLYLPLIEDVVLRDVVYRCCGNLTSYDRHYLKSQLSYLHRSIPHSPAKMFADEYRDKVLRAKGDPEEDDYNIPNEDEYFSNILRYAKEGNCIHSDFGMKRLNEDFPNGVKRS